MTDILDLIDNALEDYSLSGDAMRWTPEAPEGLPTGWRTVGVTDDGPDAVISALADRLPAVGRHVRVALEELAAPEPTSDFIRDVLGLDLEPWQRHVLNAYVPELVRVPPHPDDGPGVSRFRMVFR